MKIMKIITKSGLALISLLAASWASSAVVSATGNIAQITAPTSIAGNDFESASTISLFNERQGVSLTQDLSVDELASPGAEGVISSGTSINSYFLHYNPIGEGKTVMDVVATLTGTLTFDTQILALIWTGEACEWCPVTAKNLDSSDYLGAVGTQYSSNELGRGYEIGDHYSANGLQDIVTISPDGFSLSMVSNSTIPFYSDQLRIITAVSPGQVTEVPVPAAAWLFISALMSLSAIRRRAR